MDERYPCPGCGFLVFDGEPGSYEFCPVCDWMDDLSALRFADDPRAAGLGVSLLEHQRAWLRDNASPAPTMTYPRDPGWRPIDPDRDEIEQSVHGFDYGTTYAHDRTTYYYWRRGTREEG